MPEKKDVVHVNLASGRSLDADVQVRTPEFAELRPTQSAGESNASLDRLFDVTVAVTAELGRATLTIADVLKLGVGSVVELNRPTSQPVDLVVQGVRLARGEVTVVDDCFAIRITEIADPKKRQGAAGSQQGDPVG
jgi:flagellar motor switch protein FliN/FliY